MKSRLEVFQFYRHRKYSTLINSLFTDFERFRRPFLKIRETSKKRDVVVGEFPFLVVNTIFSGLSLSLFVTSLTRPFWYRVKIKLLLEIRRVPLKLVHRIEFCKKTWNRENNGNVLVDTNSLLRESTLPTLLIYTNGRL